MKNNIKKKIILYIAISLDGFIATKDGSVKWLDKYNESKENMGYDDFIKSIDIVIMGNTTYQQILSFDCDYPYKNKKGYVFSNKKTKKDENITFVSGNIKKIINELEGNIWLVGGANLTNQFINYNLIDEFILFTMPILLGKGIRLFEETENK
ncbi:dihydrofolate reductase, partial [bacterium]|nr:dihydrofolate reductase [bacterium]